MSGNHSDKPSDKKVTRKNIADLLRNIGERAGAMQAKKALRFADKFEKDPGLMDNLNKNKNDEGHNR